MGCSSLLELLGKYSLILHQISPYLSVADLLRLAASSKDFRNLVYNSQDTFRFLDLSTAKGARIDLPPIDIGGFNWRHERIDESTTAEDFYSGPIRGIFSSLRRKDILTSIQVLILDHVSAPADILREVICDEPWQVRILSVIESKNLNERKFQQALRYAVRPSRRPGTPTLKGVYCFGTKSRPTLENLIAPFSIGVTNSPGAQIVAALNRETHSAKCPSGMAADLNPWYQNSGKVLPRTVELRDWAVTLQACKDIISFDAVLCRGPRHDAESEIVRNNSKAFLGPQVASIALRGCEVCQSLPEGHVCSSDAPSSNLPLLAPVPRYSSNIKTAQIPNVIPGQEAGQKLFARCAICCLDRWCEGCGKFWCEDHYELDESTYTSLQQEEMLEDATPDINSATSTTTMTTTTTTAQQSSIPGSPSTTASRGSYLKVHLGLCIEQCLATELMYDSDGFWGG